MATTTGMQSAQVSRHLLQLLWSRVSLSLSLARGSPQRAEQPSAARFPEKRVERLERNQSIRNHPLASKKLHGGFLALTSFEPEAVAIALKEGVSVGAALSAHSENNVDRPHWKGDSTLPPQLAQGQEVGEKSVPVLNNKQPPVWRRDSGDVFSEDAQERNGTASLTHPQPLGVHAVELLGTRPPSAEVQPRGRIAPSRGNWSELRRHSEGRNACTRRTRVLRRETRRRSEATQESLGDGQAGDAQRGKWNFRDSKQRRRRGAGRTTWRGMVTL